VNTTLGFEVFAGAGHMLTLVNTNMMQPPIGPIGLDYIATSVRQAGIELDIVDLCLSDDPQIALRSYFDSHNPELVGLSFRNVDDSFWPSAESFLPKLAATVGTIRTLTDAAIVIGGVGFSIFAEQILEYTGADFGVAGDGEQAIVSLLEQIGSRRQFEKVAGLIWRDNGEIHFNKPVWHEPLSLPTSRDAIDNLAYFNRGGQCGIETKRGCNRRCIYCADSLSKGTALRLRRPHEVADEVETLLAARIDVFHLCDSEFNVPGAHALAICEEFNRRRLGDRMRWYTYMAVVPFDNELAEAMSRAGCVGIDFTGDSASPLMLRTYRQKHLVADIASAVRLCRTHGITVMIDLLLGGPGETPETAAETIEFIRHIEPDCAGAALGVRVYPGTEMGRIVAAEGRAESNPNIRRNYTGPVNLLKPTFYISRELGEKPARLIKDIIAGDKRFFEPMEQTPAETQLSTDHNYNDNTRLLELINSGARGAYWDMLRRITGK